MPIHLILPLLFNRLIGDIRLKSKICSKCHIEKLFNEFHKSTTGRFGLASICKVCAKRLKAEYQKNNVEKIKAYGKHYRETHKEQRKDSQLRYRKNNPEQYKAAILAWRDANPEKVKALRKAYNEKNKEKIKVFRLSYYKKNKEKFKLARKKWLKDNPEAKYAGYISTMAWKRANPEKVKEINKRYYETHKNQIRQRNKVEKNKAWNKKYHSDPKFKLNRIISRAVRNSLKNGKNGKSWTDLVGYSVNDLKKHLKKRFTTGMTWEKFLNGEIHIDHKIPITAFNFTESNQEDFKRCWALSNLQPLWAKDNLEKNAKLTKHFQPSLLL